MKECFGAINEAIAPQKLAAGIAIKAFDKEFEQEIRERNNVHHHNRFEDLAIDNLTLVAFAASS